MTERVAELLLKAVQHLPASERDEVLAALIGGALARSAPAEVPALWHLGVDLPPGTTVGPGSPARVGMQPLGTVDSLGGPLGALTGEGESSLKVLPIRLPVADYERLRAFSRQHGFSMAVIIRTLVERFLDGQARRWASRRDEPDDELDDESPAGHA